VAIGGIDENTLPEVLEAGARNFSVVRAVCGSQDPYAAIVRLTSVWRQRKARAVSSALPTDRSMS